MSQIDDINGMIKNAQAISDAAFNQLSKDITVYLTPPPAVVVPPVITPPTQVTPYQKTVRYGLANNAYKLNQYGFTAEQPIQSIPDLKGKNDLLYVGVPKPLLTGSAPHYKKEGVVFMQNETGVKYAASLPGGAPYPRELWAVLYKPNYFMFEKFMEDDPYVGELGPATLRTTNDNKDGFWFNQNVNIPVNQFFVLRLRITAQPKNTSYTNIEAWINGVKLTSSVPVQSWYRSYNVLAFGADTNNEFVGWAEFLNMPVLTDAQAAQVQAELAAEYVNPKLPYADNIQFNYANGNKTAAYTFVDPTGLKEGQKALIRWVNWPVNGGVTNGTYLTQYDGQWTVPANFAGRAEITVYNSAGVYCSMPQSKSFGN